MYLRAGEVATALVEITESRPESYQKTEARRRSEIIWNEEHISILKREWGKGLSSSRIGLLVHKSRNAVIGKAHRLKLERLAPTPHRRGRINGSVIPMVVTKRKKPNNFPPPPKPEGWVAKPRRQPPRRPIKTIGFTTNPPLTIMELRSTTCRAPMGKGEDGMETYCGGETFMNKSFCEGHCALFYSIPEPRRRA